MIVIAKKPSCYPLSICSMVCLLCLTIDLPTSKYMLKISTLTVPGHLHFLLALEWHFLLRSSFSRCCTSDIWRNENTFYFLCVVWTYYQFDATNQRRISQNMSYMPVKFYWMYLITLNTWDGEKKEANTFGLCFCIFYCHGNTCVSRSINTASKP